MTHTIIYSSQWDTKSFLLQTVMSYLKAINIPPPLRSTWSFRKIVYVVFWAHPWSENLSNECITQNKENKKAKRPLNNSQTPVRGNETRQYIAGFYTDANPHFEQIYCRTLVNLRPRMAKTVISVLTTLDRWHSCFTMGLPAGR